MCKFQMTLLTVHIPCNAFKRLTKGLHHGRDWKFYHGVFMQGSFMLWYTGVTQCTMNCSTSVAWTASFLGPWCYIVLHVLQQYISLRMEGLKGWPTGRPLGYPTFLRTVLFKNMPAAEVTWHYCCLFLQQDTSNNGNILTGKVLMADKASAFQNCHVFLLEQITSFVHSATNTRGRQQ